MAGGPGITHRNFYPSMSWAGGQDSEGPLTLVWNQALLGFSPPWGTYSLGSSMLLGGSLRHSQIPSAGSPSRKSSSVSPSPTHSRCITSTRWSWRLSSGSPTARSGTWWLRSWISCRNTLSWGELHTGRRRVQPGACCGPEDGPALLFSDLLLPHYLYPATVLRTAMSWCPFQNSAWRMPGPKWKTTAWRCGVRTPWWVPKGL